MFRTKSGSLSPGIFITASFLLLFSSAAMAQETIEILDGFELRENLEFDPANGGLGGLVFTPDGDVVVYDAGDILLIDDADNRTSLANFAEAPFGSFVVLAPGGNSVIFGENTNGGLFEIALVGGGATQVDTLGFNFDMVFDAEGRGFVSALAADFVRNEVFLFDNDPDTETPNQSIVVDIPGFSGPVTVDGDGQLYYGTSEFSNNASFQKIVRFSKAQVDAAVAGAPVAYEDGEVILSELDGIFDMLFVGNRLFYSDLGFLSGEGRVWMLDGDQNFLEKRFVTMTGDERVVSPSFLTYRPGDLPFEAGIGPRGGTFAVAYSDFATVNRVGFFVPQLWFVRGEVNGDGFVDLSDGISILLFLFLGCSAPDPLAAADIDDSGSVDTTDVILLLEHIFLGGPPPAAPYPEPGADPTP